MNLESAVKLIAIANEVFHRLDEERSKTAKYEATVEEYGQKIAKKLASQGLIDQDDVERVQATLRNSPSAAVELLHDLVKAMEDVKTASTRYNSLGQPYSAPSYRASRHASDINPALIEGFSIDISRLR